MARKKIDYTNIPKEKFEFFDRSEAIHDKKLETKPVGYFKDAMMRFCRNKSSLTAAIIIALLLAFALVVPLVSNNNYTNAKTDTTYLQYGKLLPKSRLFAWAGWDGAKRETISSDMYAYYEAMETERGVNAIKKVYKADYEDSSSTSNSTFYDVRVDSYSKIGMLNLTLTKAACVWKYCKFGKICASRAFGGVDKRLYAACKNKRSDSFSGDGSPRDAKFHGSGLPDDLR